MLSLANLQLVARDQKLPGLEFLLDPERIQPVLLAMLGENANQAIPECSLNYLRYKPNRRCIAVFDLTAGGNTESFVATAMTSESWNRRKAIPPTATPHSALDDQLIRLERFPQDRQLPAVAKVFDPNKSSTVLRRILSAGSETAHGFGRMQDVRLVRLAYKPGRRFVGAVHCDGLPRFTLKFYTKRGYINAAANALLLSKINNINVRLNDRYHVVAFPWVAGQCLATLSQGGMNPGVLAAFEATGRQLAQLHQLSVSAYPLPPRSLAMDSEATQLRELANDVSYLVPQYSALVGQVADFVCRNVRAPTTVIHGDFYAKQVIVGDDQIHFIDFDDCSLGNPYGDLGNFVAKLHWSEVRGHIAPYELEPMIGAFLQGYQQCTHRWDDCAFRSQLCASILRCAPLPFRGGHVNWPSLTLKLLERAHDIARVEVSAKLALDRSQTSSVVPLQNADELVEQCLDPQVILRELKTSTTVCLPATPHAVQTRILRLKPNRRCLIELRLSLNATGPFAKEQTNASGAHCVPASMAVLAKIRFKGLDRRTPGLHQQLVLAGFDRWSEVSVPACLGMIPRLNLWLQEKVDARRVTACDLTSNDDHVRIARAIARLHQADVAVVRHHSVDDEWQLLSARLRSASASNPQYAELLERLRRQCVDCITTYLSYHSTANQCCLIHRDFYFDQVLIDAERVTLLDLDLACMGPPGLDVGNYIAHLYEYSVRAVLPLALSTERIREFSDAYIHANPMVTAKEIAFWTFLSLCRLTCLSTIIPGRGHCTHQLVEECLRYGQEWLTRNNTNKRLVLG